MLIFSFQYSTTEFSGITGWMKPDKNQTSGYSLSTFKFSRKKGKAWISVKQYHLLRVCWTGSLCFPELLDSQALLTSHSRESLHEVRHKPVLKHTLERGKDRWELLPWKEGSGGRRLLCPSTRDGINFGAARSHRPWGSSRASGFLQLCRANTLSCNGIPEIPNDGKDCVSKLNLCHLFFWKRNATLCNCRSSGFASTSASFPGPVWGLKWQPRNRDGHGKH